MKTAIQRGHLKKFSKTQQFKNWKDERNPCIIAVSDFAAFNNYIDDFKYLLSIGFPWSSQVTALMVHHENTEIR